MCTSAKGLLAILLATLAFPALIFAAPSTNLINLPNTELGFGFGFEDEDEEPAVTDRVARVTVVDGEAKIRRVESDEWEKVTNNLPLVEGDELVTSSGGRVEIQFAKNQHIRLDENSYLKIAGLKDEGIALSLSLGSISVRVIDFDTGRTFFEIDAPKATISIQRSGSYRVNAGREGDSEITASVSEDGEARIYTEHSGFTLRNNRSARIFIDGGRAGEWEPVDTPGLSDNFAMWIAEREDFVAKQLSNAYFGKYYDDDIYGAEELDEHGEWLDTPEYGHVWRPSRLAISQYSDWSPYRYGHWRFMRPYGWVWVNDEPWGWATYHYGRWVYHRGGWVWAPYGYYRPGRSWWWPAYVSINIYNNNVCWYPLGYYKRRHHYNRDYETPRRKGPRSVRTPPPTRSLPPGTISKGPRSDRDEVPPNGVVGIEKKDFGVVRSIRPLPTTVVKEVLTKSENGGGLTGVPVPTRNTRQLNTVAADRPKIESRSLRVPTGAAPRTSEKALDTELRKTRILGGRPLRVAPDPVVQPGDPIRTSEPRKTGVVDRPPTTRQTAPVRNPAPVELDPEPIREKPRRAEPPVRETYTPPAPERTKETREVRETPRYDPPPRQPEKPRDDPPAKAAPRNDPPPAKSEPKKEEKPDAPPSGRREKPGVR